MLENEEIVNEQPEVTITSINPEAIQKITNKKASIKKEATHVILAALVLVASLGVYQYMNKEAEPAMDSTPISEIIKGIEEVNTNELGTKEVNGVVYDLDAMKKDLGLMYYYAEPLTNTELDKEFIGILNYIEQINKANDKLPIDKGYDFYGFSVEKQAQIPNELLIAYANKAMENLWDVKDNHPEFSDTVDLYLAETDYSKVWDYVDGKIKFEQLSKTDKEKFVKDWKYNFNYWQQTYKDAGLNPNPDFSLTNTSFEIDFENEVVYIKQI